MSSQYNFSVVLKGNKVALSDAKNVIHQGAYDGGSCTIYDLLNSIGDTKIKKEVLGENWDADSHHIGLVGISLLDVKLWKDVFKKCDRHFLSGTGMSGDCLTIYFYGPNECTALWEFIVKNCDSVTEYEVYEEDDEDDDYDDYDEDYE